MSSHSIAFAIIWIFAVAYAYAGEDTWKPKNSAEMRDIRNECLKEHPLTDEQKNNMKDFIFPDVEEVRQYLLCTAIKMGVFDASDHGYYPERIAQQFKMHMDEAEVLEIAKGCVDANEVGSPVDVWAFRGHKCLMSSKIGDEVKDYLKKKREEAAKQANA